MFKQVKKKYQKGGVRKLTPADIQPVYSDIHNFTPNINLTPEEILFNKNKNEISKKGLEEYHKKVLQDRQKRINTSNNSNPFKNPTRQELANSVEGTPDKMRLFPNSTEVGQMFDEYLNPAYFIGSMAKGLGKAPLEAQKTNSNTPYLSAIGTPLVAGALGFNPLTSSPKQNLANFSDSYLWPIEKAIRYDLPEITPQILKSVKKIPEHLNNLSQAKDLNEALGYVTGLPIEKTLPRLPKEQLKTFRQLQDLGRMQDTQKSLSDRLRYAIDNNLPEEHFQSVFGQSKQEAQDLLNSGFESSPQTSPLSSIDLRRLPRVRPVRNNAPLEFRNIPESNIDNPHEYIRNIINQNTEGTTDLNHYTNNPDELLRQLYGPNRETSINFQLSDELRNRINGSDRDEAIRNILDAPPDEIHYNPLSEEQINRIRGNTLIPNQRNPISLLQTAKNDINRNINPDVLADKVLSKVSKYPLYKGQVSEKVPILTMSGEGNSKNVADKIFSAPENIQSGDVFTGSTNTSHNSYLPQLKQVFGYKQGNPQFLGYKPMNSMGYLSRYDIPQEDIAKYLNTEIDQAIKAKRVPDNIQRPFLKGEHIVLPQYGVKQFQKGGFSVNGYKKDSPHKNRDFNIINSNHITTDNMAFPIIANGKILHPNTGDYIFPEGQVYEEPLKFKSGGSLYKGEAAAILKQGTIYNHPLSKKQITFFKQLAKKDLQKKQVGGKINPQDIKPVYSSTTAIQKPYVEQYPENMIYPPVVVTGHKDEQTRDFYDMVKSAAFPTYQALTEMGRKYGFMKIKPYTKYKFDDGTERASFNSNTNTAFIGSGPGFEKVDNYLAELPHKIQLQRDGKMKSYLIDQYENLKYKHNDDTYSIPGTIENEAHSLIEPKIREEFKKRKFDVKADEIYQEGGFTQLGTVARPRIDTDLNNVKAPDLTGKQSSLSFIQPQVKREQRDFSFAPILTNSIMSAIATRIDNNRQNPNLINPLSYIPNVDSTNNYQNYGTPQFQDGGQVNEDDYENMDDSFLFGDDDVQIEQPVVQQAQQQEEVPQVQQEEDPIIQLDNSVFDENIDENNIQNFGSNQGLVPNIRMSENNVNTSQNETDATNYLIQKGLQPHIAAGIIGNLTQESNLKPNAIEKGGNGRGIAQWDKRDRWQSLLQFADQYGKDPYDLHTQLDFLLEEAKQRGDLNKINSAQNPSQAAYLFAKHFERPKNIEPVRMQNAERVFKKVQSRK